MRRLLTLSLVVAATLVVGLGACSSGESGLQSAGSGTIGSAESSAFPFGSLSDVRSYATHVAVAEVTGEREVEGSTDVHSAEGTTGQILTIEVDEVLWSTDRSSLDTFEMTHHGWFVKDGQHRPIVPETGPRLSLADRFVGVFVQESGEVGLMSSGAALLLDDGVVTILDKDLDGPFLRSLDGRSSAEVERLVAEANPDPLAEKYWDLAPTQRAMRVAEERAGEHPD